MATVLKVDEWYSPAGHWYVADVHTWTSWHAEADIFGKESLQDYVDFLKEEYHAHIEKIYEYEDKPELIIFWWPKANYRYAHQFKLDVNRIARQRKYMV